LALYSPIDRAWKIASRLRHPVTTDGEPHNPTVTVCFIHYEEIHTSHDE
jgi:hypothetical protein